MNKKILIIGKNSSLSKSILKLLNNHQNIYKIGKDEIDFCKKNSEKKIINIIKDIKPQIIINFAGIFGDNKIDIEKVFKINTYPTWYIIKQLIKTKPKKKIHLIIIGSSAYKGPRKKYISYAASKSALNHIVKSAQDYFQKNKFLKISIVNPKPIKTVMTIKMNKKFTHISYYANKIFRLINS